MIRSAISTLFVRLILVLVIATGAIASVAPSTAASQAALNPSSAERSSSKKKAVAKKNSTEDDTEEDIVELIPRMIKRVFEIGPPCPDCDAAFAGDEPPSACRQAYERVYAKNVVEMKVVFGYNDQGDRVLDRFQKAALAEQLTSECPENPKEVARPRVGACGFVRDDTAEFFTKTIKGPDGVTDKVVRLQVVASSASDSDSVNRRSYTNGKGGAMGDQDIASAHAKQVHHEALCDGSAVALYSGHARVGAGPSYEPPEITIGKDKVKSVNYDYYRTPAARAKSFGEFIKKLQDCPDRPELIGIFACDAEDLFGPDLMLSAPETGLMLSNGDTTFVAAAFGQTFAALDSALAMRCEEEFNDSLYIDLLAGTTPPEKALKVKNFFR